MAMTVFLPHLGKGEAVPSCSSGTGLMTVCHRAIAHLSRLIVYLPCGINCQIIIRTFWSAAISELHPSPCLCVVAAGPYSR